VTGAPRNAAEGLAGLYRETVLEHSRNPRNFRRPARVDRHAEGHNTLCGDKVTVYLDLEGDRLADVCFEGAGCAISLASASLMTEALQGLDQAAAITVVRDFLQSFSGPDAPPPAGALAALAGVRAYPSRIRCATLPWQTAAAALAGQAGTVSTEPQGIPQPDTGPESSPHHG
jgi:nitrogen fixation NifU-like protein